jgi:type IV secretion system protein VirB9
MIRRTLIAGLALLPASLAAAEGWTTSVQPADSLKEGKARPDGPPPRLNPLGGPQAPLTRKERRGVAYGRQWAENPDMPARGADGGIVFTFGATLPTVVCAPLYVCDLVLEAGETVNDLNIGDSVRWQIIPATQGAGEDQTTHVIIKPTDIGLITNLIITTNRRAYTIKLVSRAEDWMPRIAFHYPDNLRLQWGAYRQAASARSEAAQAAIGSGAADFDFGYSVSGDNPAWRPVRVFANGAKTYIEFPSDIGAGDLPTLVALSDDGGLFTEPSKRLVNYRFINGRFEVDKVLQRAALISGVGRDQIAVRIERRGGGW